MVLFTLETSVLTCMFKINFESNINLKRFCNQFSKRNILEVNLRMSYLSNLSGIETHFPLENLIIVSATRKRRDIQMPLCLLVHVWKSLI